MNSPFNRELGVTKNYKFLRDNWEDFEIFVLEGSTRSGKTVAIVQWLIGKCLTQPNFMVRCVRFDSTTHTESTIQDIEMVLMMYGLEHGKDYTTNRQQKKWLFRNGATITCSATNEIAKLHGMKTGNEEKVVDGVLTGGGCLWLNEVMEITYAAYKQLKNRTMGKTIMDFNPSFSRHWVFRAILNENGQRPANVGYIHSTYKDNKFLTPEQVRSIEDADPANIENVERGTADQFVWDVYGLGKRGKIKGAVYGNWDTTDWFPPDPMICQKWGFGLDFGYQADHSALVEVCLHQNKLFIRERLYETNILVTRNKSRPMITSIQSELEAMNIPKQAPICADSAAPESCAQLNMLGWNIVPVKKGPGSILAGINILKRYQIYVHESSYNLIDELQSYIWREQTYKDHEAIRRPEPIDRSNHLLDGLRYFAMMYLDIPPTDDLPAHLRRGPRGGGPRVKNRARDRRRL